MKKIVVLLIVSLLLFSCNTQKKTVELANGKMITEKQYAKLLNSSLKKANRAANKSVKNKLSRKQRKELFNNVSIKVDTSN